MTAKRKHPTFLNLLIIRLPVAGVSSILHRVTGVFLVVLLPFLLYGLDHSLRDSRGFTQVVDLFKSIPARLAAFAVLALFAQHFATGIRHVLLSMGLGLSLRAASLSAWVTFAFTLIVLVAFGVWIG